MPWLTLLHISAVATWCGLLLYVPAMVAINRGEPAHMAEELSSQAFARYLFTFAATPAALIAIISGTAIFVRDANIAAWLLIKLLVVSGLVIGHVLCGLLVLRAEEHPARSHRGPCMTLGLTMLLLILAVLWLVLMRPG